MKLRFERSSLTIDTLNAALGLKKQIVGLEVSPRGIVLEISGELDATDIAKVETLLKSRNMSLKEIVAGT